LGNPGTKGMESIMTKLSCDSQLQIKATRGMSISKRGISDVSG
jgi:hypothetical protein